MLFEWLTAICILSFLFALAVSAWLPKHVEKEVDLALEVSDGEDCACEWCEASRGVPYRDAESTPGIDEPHQICELRSCACECATCADVRGTDGV